MPRRYESLDGLRGISAIAVVLFHITWSNHITETHLIRESYVFVDLFFILSGFVITKAYSTRVHTLREAGSFLALRFFRIYPLHIAVLLVFILCEMAKIPAIYLGLDVHPFDDAKGWALVSNLFLVHSLTFSFEFPTWNVPSWSISSEMVAYVVFAVIAWTGLMNRRQLVYFITVLAAGFYTIVLYYKGSLFALLDLGLLRCLAGFCVGVAVSTISESPLAKIPTAIYNAAIGILTTIAIAVLSLLNGVFDIVIVPIFGLLVLLLQTDSGLPARILKSTPIAFLGQISYSIYMVHWLLLLLATTGLKYVTKTPLYDGMYKANLLLGDLGVILMLMLIVLVASITYRNIEAPWRSFGRRTLTLYTEAGVADRQISPA